MNRSLHHTANGHFSHRISQLRALGPKIMGNILQHSCVTLPLVLTGGLCLKSGCIHQQSELDITEAPNERSSFIPGNDPPREQPQLFTHLCTALAQENVYSVAGKTGIRGSRAVSYHLSLRIKPQGSLSQPHTDGPAQTGLRAQVLSVTTAGFKGWMIAEA